MWKDDMGMANKIHIFRRPLCQPSEAAFFRPAALVAKCHDQPRITLHKPSFCTVLERFLFLCPAAIGTFWKSARGAGEMPGLLLTLEDVLGRWPHGSLKRS